MQIATVWVVQRNCGRTVLQRQRCTGGIRLCRDANANANAVAALLSATADADQTQVGRGRAALPSAGAAGGLGLVPSPACAWLYLRLSVKCLPCMLSPLAASPLKRPPSAQFADSQLYSPFTACVTGSQLLSVRTRRHQPQPPAELCSAAAGAGAGTVQRPA